MVAKIKQQDKKGHGRKNYGNGWNQDAQMLAALAVRALGPHKGASTKVQKINAILFEVDDSKYSTRETGTQRKIRKGEVL